MRVEAATIVGVRAAVVGVDREWGLRRSSGGGGSNNGGGGSNNVDAYGDGNSEGARGGSRSGDGGLEVTMKVRALAATVGVEATILRVWQQQWRREQQALNGGVATCTPVAVSSSAATTAARPAATVGVEAATMTTMRVDATIVEVQAATHSGGGGSNSGGGDSSRGITTFFTTR